MKFTLIFLTVITIILQSSCDRVENPVVVRDTSLDWTLYPDADTSTYPWPTWTQNTNTAQRVLLEDFTGHTCTNCPAAAVVAKNIEDANGGNVIVMSVHASVGGGFQQPSLPNYPLDHRTDAGNAYAIAMNMTLNPSGTINRAITNGEYSAFSSDWSNLVNTQLAKTPDFNIQCAFNYYPQTSGLFLHLETEVLNDVQGTFDIVSLLVRDTLIADQEFPQGLHEEEYDHHSVLTDNISDIWGTPIIDGQSTSGTKLYNNYTYVVPSSDTDSSYKINNLSVITFISDRDTYEVKQVIKTPLFE